MSELDQLLSRAQNTSGFVEKTRFTLAQSKAIEKMREFTLRHPRQYVLELLQGAAFNGARWMVVETSSRGLLLAWIGGKPLKRKELSNLMNYLFSDQGVQETRHLMQMAIGLNSAMQNGAVTIQIESGDGTKEGSIRCDLNSDGEAVIGKPAQPMLGTYVRINTVRKWFSRFRSSDEIVELIELRCRHTSVPILLNGRFPFGMSKSKNVVLGGVSNSAPVPAPRGGKIGVSKTLESRIRIVIGGVEVCERANTPLGDRIVGVIKDDRLRKTADMSDIVEDAGWVDLLHDLQPIATKLIRKLVPRYTPPKLPDPIVTTEATAATVAEIAAEPLPAGISQVGKRPGLDREALARVMGSEHVFWCEHDVAEQLVEPCMAWRFPYPILVLSPGQARTLTESLSTSDMDTGPTLAQLTTPEDVSFVRTALDRSQNWVDITFNAEFRQPGFEVPVTLRLYLDGRPPFQTYHPESPTSPFSLHANGKMLDIGQLDLGLHYLAIGVDLSSLSDPQDSITGIRQQLREIVEANTWRLLETIDVNDDRYTRLQMELLVDYAAPAFERHSDGSLELDVWFPTTWSAFADRLLQAPLASTSDGPLTLARLIQMQGTREVLHLRSAADRDVLEILERRYGYGHLPIPEDLEIPITTMGRTNRGWRYYLFGTYGDDDCTDMLMFYASYALPEPPPGWTLADSGIPGVAHWVREGATPAPIDDAAVVELERMLFALSKRGIQTFVGCSHRSSDRAQRMFYLAYLRFCLKYADTFNPRYPNAEGRLTPITQFIRQNTPIRPRGGQRGTIDTALPLSYEEALVFDEIRAHLGLESPTPLLLDDDPEVWTAAANPQEWIARMPVRLAELTGWVGLRYPVDTTTAVVLENPKDTKIIDNALQRTPCHGLLKKSTSTTLKKAEIQMLNLAGLQLYERVLRVMIEDPDPDRRAAAQHYACGFVARAHLRDAKARHEGLVAAMARAIVVREKAGTRWGSLWDWYEAKESVRPDPPPGASEVAAVAPAQKKAAARDDGYGEWRFIQVPLQAVLSQCGWPVMVSINNAPDWTDEAIEVQARHSVTVKIRHDAFAQKALAGDVVARGILQYEVARLVHEEATKWGIDLSLQALQMWLLAAQLDS